MPMSQYEEITPQALENEQKNEIEVCKGRKISWVAVQALLCVLILVALLAAKSLFPKSYELFRVWYDEEMKRSVWVEYDGDIPTV